MYNKIYGKYDIQVKEILADMKNLYDQLSKGV